MTLQESKDLLGLPSTTFKDKMRYFLVCPDMELIQDL